MRSPSLSPMQGTRHSKQGAYRFGSFQLDLVGRKLLRDGQRVALTSKRFDILLVLIRNRDRVVSKDELMREVWPDTVVEETNLTHNISALRKALGEKAGEHRFIVTVSGQGYQFVASLEESEDDRGPEIVFERSRLRLVIEEDYSDGRIPDQRANGISAQATALAESAKSSVAEGTKIRNLSLSIALLLVVSGIAIAVYLLAGSRSVQPEPFRKINMSRLTTAGKAESAVISPDGKYLAYVIEDAQGQSLWLRHLSTSSNAVLVPSLPVLYWGITFSPDGDYVYYCTFESTRPHDNLYRVAILGGPPTLLPVETNSPITFSPDGRQFAYVLPRSGGETHLKLANADGTAITTLAKVTDPHFFLSYPGGPAWSPDGKKIACSIATSASKGLSCRLVAIKVVDGEQVAMTKGYWNYIGQAAWLADGSGILFIGVEKPAAPNQVYLISTRTGETRRVTNDLRDYRGVSLTSDSSSLVTVERHVASSLRVASSYNIGLAREIVAESGQIGQVRFTRDGKLVYSSSASGEPALWSISSDGSERTQLVASAISDLGFSVSPDGRYVVYTSALAGTINLWRLDTHKGASVRLTNGNAENRPQCSPDGRWVIYEQGIGNVTRTLWKVPIEGGEPLQLTEFHAIRPSLSPDGKSIAFYFKDRSRENSPWCIGIVSTEGGEMTVKFDIPATVTSRFVNWTADSKNLAYINDTGGVSNIWIQPLDGAAPRQITDFQLGRIVVFDWSPDGKQFVFSKVSESSYVALATELLE